MNEIQRKHNEEKDYKSHKYHPEISKNTKEILSKMSLSKSRKSIVSRNYNSRDSNKENYASVVLKKPRRGSRDMRSVSGNKIRQNVRRKIFKYEDKQDKNVFSREVGFDFSDEILGRSTKKRGKKVGRSQAKRRRRRSMVPQLDQEIEFFNSKDSRTDNGDDSFWARNGKTPRFRKPTIAALLKSPNQKKIKENLSKSPAFRRRKKRKPSPRNQSEDGLASQREGHSDFITRYNNRNKKRSVSRKERPKDFNPKKSGYKFFHRAREIAKNKKYRELNHQQDLQHVMRCKRNRASRKKFILEHQAHSLKKRRRDSRYRKGDVSIGKVSVMPHEDDLRRKIIRKSKMIF